MNTSAAQRKQFQLALGFFASAVILLIVPLFIPTLWFTTLVAFVPLFLCSVYLPTKWAIGTASAACFIYFNVVTYPLSTINTWWWTTIGGLIWEYKHVLYFGATFLLAVITCAVSFFPFFYFYNKKLKNFPRMSIILLPTLWFFLEMIRIKILFGLEWGIFGLPLGENLLFARSVAIGSTIFLSSVAILCNYCIFLVVQTFLRAEKRQRLAANLALPLIILILISAGLFVNSYLFDKKSLFLASNEQIRVALLNPKLKTSEIANQTGTDHVISLLEEATEGKPDIVITPEQILPFLPLDEATKKPIAYEESLKIRASFEKILEISKNNPKTSFMIGFHTKKTEFWLNSAVLFEKGEVVSIYNKQKLLPFTENSFGFLENLHIDPLTAGTGENAIETEHGIVVPLICSEVLATGLVPKEVKAAETTEKSLQKSLIMTNLSNDNIFDSPRVAAHNRTMSRLRAIVQQQPIIRSSKGGFSGAFDATGQEISTVKSSTGEILFTTVGYPRKSF